MNMYLVSCLFSNTMSSVGWYVDSGASRHMTYDLILKYLGSRGRLECRAW